MQSPLHSVLLAAEPGDLSRPANNHKAVLAGGSLGLLPITIEPILGPPPGKLERSHQTSLTVSQLVHQLQVSVKDCGVLSQTWRRKQRPTRRSSFRSRKRRCAGLKPSVLCSIRLICGQCVFIPLEQQRRDCILVQGTEGTEAAGGLSKSQKKKQKKKAAAERKKVCEGADAGPTTPPGVLPAQAEPHTAHALRTQLAGSSQLHLLT